MPATPPPSSASPPTSSQLYQQAIRSQNRLQRDGGSPELRRVPSTSTAFPTVFPPPLPPQSISTPITFNGQLFNHLPADIVARMRNLQPFPVSSRREHNAIVSFIFYLLYIYNKLIYY